MQQIFKFFLNLIPRTVLIRLSYLVRPFVAYFLRGEKYTDPIDGNSFRKFLPYGYEKVRENVLSPSTLSLERHRLFWLYLKNETAFFTKNLKVLHFAPEQAFYKRFKKMKNLLMRFWLSYLFPRQRKPWICFLLEMRQQLVQ